MNGFVGDTASEGARIRHLVAAHFCYRRDVGMGDIQMHTRLRTFCLFALLSVRHSFHAHARTHTRTHTRTHGRLHPTCSVIIKTNHRHRTLLKKMSYDQRDTTESWNRHVHKTRNLCTTYTHTSTSTHAHTHKSQIHTYMHKETQMKKIFPAFTASFHPESGVQPELDRD
jgi:hypothetical protein